MKDINGRAYATVAATKTGDTLEADDGFTCIDAGSRLKVEADDDGIYVACADGRHHLDGQIKTEGTVEAHYIGLYPAA